MKKAKIYIELSKNDITGAIIFYIKDKGRSVVYEMKLCYSHLALKMDPVSIPRKYLDDELQFRLDDINLIFGLNLKLPEKNNWEYYN